MLPKFVIFVISGIFAVSIYASSATGMPTATYGNLRCHMDPEGNSGICCYFGEPPVCYSCTLQENGKWDCVKFDTSAQPPPALKDAIVKSQAAIAGGGLSTGQNNTIVKNGGQLKSGGSFKGGY